MVQNLVPDDSNHLKGLPRSHRVHQHVAMNANEVFGVQDAILVLSVPAGWSGRPCLHEAILGMPTYLPCRVDYLSSVVLAFVFDYFTERILDRGVVAFDEVAVHELDSKG